MVCPEEQWWGRERPSHPELSQVAPEQLFAWVQADIAKHRRIYGADQARFGEYVSQRAYDLEQYLTSHFAALPEVSIETFDATRTVQLTNPGIGVYVLRAAQMAAEEAEGAPYAGVAVQGRLFGFYKGAMGDFRMYIEDASRNQQQLPGGLYTPLVSVAVEGSRIEYVLTPEQERAAFQARVDEHIAQIADYQRRELVQGLYHGLLNRLDASSQPPATRLKNVSHAIAKITGAGIAEDEPLMNVLLDMVHANLGLVAPQTIEAAQYRLLIGASGYKAETAARFEGVTPALGFFGDMRHRSFGLLFFNAQEQGIQIPAESVTHLAPYQPPERGGSSS